jgi:hypothetical protein
MLRDRSSPRGICDLGSSRDRARDAGQLDQALILTAWGTIVVGLIDNLLYPILVGKEVRLHRIEQLDPARQRAVRSR